MKDHKDITIAALCVSATILATVLVLLWQTPPAVAGTPVRGGDYIWVNGSISNSIDLLYILDVAVQKVNVYAVDAVQNQAVIRDQLDLKREFK